MTGAAVGSLVGLSVMGEALGLPVVTVGAKVMGLLVTGAVVGL